MAPTPAAPKTNRPTKNGLPEDRFDRIDRSGRVGAHRVTVRPRHVWQYLIAALLGFALLTTVGIVVVQSIGNVEGLPVLGNNSASKNAQSPAKAKLDPTATVVILNGTPIPNLAEDLGDIVTQKQWGQVVLTSSTEKPDVKISAVFYRDAADASAAAGLAAKLGGISTYTTENYEDYKAKLIVLIGDDYAGPGLDEAKAKASKSDAPESTEPEIDPATGNTIDPATGQPVDPNASEPAQ